MHIFSIQILKGYFIDCNLQMQDFIKDSSTKNIFSGQKGCEFVQKQD